MISSGGHEIAVAGFEDKRADAFDGLFQRSGNYPVGLVLVVQMMRVNRLGIVDPLVNTIALRNQYMPKHSRIRRVFFGPFNDFVVTVQDRSNERVRIRISQFRLRSAEHCSIE